MQELKEIRRALYDLGRPLLFLFCSVSLAAIGTFRNFGYDLNGPGELRVGYPDVAGGWGIWSWLTELKLDFNTYFFVLSLILATGILMLAFPARIDKCSPSVSITLAIYLTFWFLFAHTRYGTAVVLISLAVASNSLWLVAIAIPVAFLFHKAVAGGVILVFVWFFLRRQKYGLFLAMLFCAAFGLILVRQTDNILLLTAYNSYSGWIADGPLVTPLKYYFDIAILVIWKSYDWRAPDALLILALLFLPTSYFIVIAGRAHEFYAAIFLSLLLTSSAPRLLKYALLSEFLLDTWKQLFLSGAYF